MHTHAHAPPDCAAPATTGTPREGQPCSPPSPPLPSPPPPHPLPPPDRAPPGASNSGGAAAAAAAAAAVAAGGQRGGGGRAGRPRTGAGRPPTMGAGAWGPGSARARWGGRGRVARISPAAARRTGGGAQSRLGCCCCCCPCRWLRRGSSGPRRRSPRPPPVEGTIKRKAIHACAVGGCARKSAREKSSPTAWGKRNVPGWSRAGFWRGHGSGGGRCSAARGWPAAGRQRAGRRAAAVHGAGVFPRGSGRPAGLVGF
jgi:hypothetical protein